jgi:hypothetical protein
MENKKGGYSISQNEKWQNKGCKFDEKNLPAPFIFHSEMENDVDKILTKLTHDLKFHEDVFGVHHANVWSQDVYHMEEVADQS